MWFFVTESLLAFTIFRDEFDIPFAVMFGFLLFVKSFHWLMADRVEWMDQMPYPGPPTLFHVRVNSLFVVLWITNFVMFAFAVENILTNGIGAMVLFASEYAILMASAMNAMAKYVLSAIEFRRAAFRGGENAPPWENKSMWVFYVDLTTGKSYFLKLTTYLTFFTFILTFYGVPLNVVRDIYVTARSFITRLRTLIRYHTATRNMDERYPNATEDEMAAMSDRTCIICREEMVVRNPPREGNSADDSGSSNTSRDGPNTTPKKLPCGHIFHFHCLRSWLERQQSCPTCRRAVLDTDPQASSGRAGRRGAGRGPQQPGAAPGLGNVARQPAVPQPQPPPPPYMQGQFPPPYIPAQIPQAAQPGEIFGWGPINPPQGYAYPQAPQQLHPPPMFQGFYGPGGLWHPWGMDERWFAAGQQVPTQAGNAPANDISVNSAPSTPPTSAQQPSSSDMRSASSPARASSTDSAAPPATPRDAAALAALRRTGASSVSDSGTVTPPENSSHSQLDSEAGHGTSLPSTAGPSSAGSAGPTGSAEPSRSIPALIPLYSLAHPRPMHTPPYAAGSVGLPPFRNVERTNPGPPYPSHWQPQHHNYTGAARPPPSGSHRSAPPSFQRGEPRSQNRGPTSAAHPPMSLLPATLTEDQLGRLDRLTRDAIDERLRVLEGVSGAVYRCIEELMMVRSVLPPNPSQEVHATSAPPDGQVPSQPVEASVAWLRRPLQSHPLAADNSVQDSSDVSETLEAQGISSDPSAVHLPSEVQRAQETVD
ncbi:hypothetical protein EW146_g4999 [Bondarzewia mesenterica]|uniref:RING-type E3 ubiquitin transferase n=1 Tax=Bondarzewia mesenterica TaxID=1095465 RepID=A0A4S4LSR6_9AGAM|nr:hypothetical protein EW146_g4999 [Bondarzewia mesenterica]